MKKDKKRLQMLISRYYGTSSPCDSVRDVVGISKMQFMDFIDSHFWDESISRVNYGLLWQLDHIVPQHLFDISKEEDLLLCYNYMNYIPMLKHDNVLKGGSIHFSVQILNKRLMQYPDNTTVLSLLDRCQAELDSRWAKYS
jgi:hypothetical protein